MFASQHFGSRNSDANFAEAHITHKSLREVTTIVQFAAAYFPILSLKSLPKKIATKILESVLPDSGH